jgi:peptidoglycan-associated lipoprotein
VCHELAVQALHVDGGRTRRANARRTRGDQPMNPMPLRPWRSMLAAAAAATLAACAHKGPPPLADTGPPPPPPPAERYTPPPAPAPSPPVASAPAGPVPGSVRDFQVNAGDRVYFGFNEYNLTAEGRQVLDMQSGWLQRFPSVMVRIEGNCDEKGTREYNLALGARRAEAVKEYLVSRGVSAARITTISYGKERPMDTGTGEEADAHNRNAHTAITAGAVGPIGDAQ